MEAACDECAMNWSDIKDVVANVAPLLGSALGGPAGGAVGGIIAAALGTEASPEAVDQVIKQDPTAAIRLKEIQSQHQMELTRIVMQHEMAQLESVNKTMRAEYAQEDKYVKRWRPTFGYCVAITWVLQTTGVAAAVLWATASSPETAGTIISGISSVAGAVSVQWGVALSVLGISVHNRSKDKQLLAGSVSQDMRSLKQKLLG